MATYKKYATKDGTPIQVQSAIEDGQGRQIDETYVEHNSYDGTLSVGYSDSTGAIKTDYGVELNAGATIDGHLDEPFLFRPTAYPFNRDVITIGGQKATVKEVRAYAFVKNQFTNFNYNSTQYGVRFIGTHLEVDTGERVVGILTPQNLSNPIPTGHKVLNLLVCKSGNYTGQDIGFGGYHTESGNNRWQGLLSIPKDTNIAGKVYASIATTTNTVTDLMLFVNSGTVNVTTKIEAERYFIDLTKWFNNDTTILSKTNETWFVPWFLNNFGKYIPTYSTGEIENTYATKITTNGVNQWDGTNDIRVSPKTQYYCKGSATLTYKDIDGNTIDTATVSDAVFTTPDNCIYVGVDGSGNIQICLHWTEPTIEQTYHPYEKWVFNIDWSAIGTPLGINSQIGDYKDFVNGKNGKVVGSVDLETLNWQKSSNNRAYAIVPASANWKIVDSYTLAPMMTANYSIIGYQTLNTNPTASDKVIAYWGLSNNNYLIMFRDTALLTDDITTTAQIQALMSGKIMQVQLEVPTLTDMTESEKLTNTYNVNDYGTEEFDNVCALDVLYQNNLVRQIVNNQTAIADHEQRIDALETEVAGIKGLPTAPSTNGNYRLRCTVADGVATYTWVEEN